MTENRQVENTEALIRWAATLSIDVPKRHAAWFTQALVEWALGDAESQLLHPVRLGLLGPDHYDWNNMVYATTAQQAVVDRLRKQIQPPDASDNGLGFIFMPPLPRSAAHDMITLVVGSMWRSQLDDIEAHASFSQVLYIAQMRDRALMLGNDKGLAGDEGTTLVMRSANGFTWLRLATDKAKMRENIALNGSIDYSEFEPTLDVLSLRDPAGHSMAVLTMDMDRGIIHSVTAKGLAPVEPQCIVYFNVLLEKLGIRGVIEAAAMPQDWVEIMRVPPDSEEAVTKAGKNKCPPMTMG